MSRDVSEEAILSKKEVLDLLDWFHRDAVEYPWGDKPTPYRVWISEIMLQQTVVSAAVNHFIRWMDQFPDIASLAKAEEQAVLKAWEGLGYYSRARNIHKAALYLMDHNRGELPGNYSDLVKIPGIGDYTARAVLSLAFSEPYPVLDANVRRIGQRLMGQIDWDKRDDQLLVDRLQKLIPRNAPGVFNCALMQLGQLICRVRSPECGICPVRVSCRTRKEGMQDDIPAVKKRLINEKTSTLYILSARGSILLIRRSRGIGKGLWFIPSVLQGEEGQVLTDLRELIGQSENLEKRVHLYTTWKEHLSPVLLHLKEVPSEVPLWVYRHKDDQARWISCNDLNSYPTPSVYRKILDGISC